MDFLFMADYGGLDYIEDVCAYPMRLLYSIATPFKAWWTGKKKKRALAQNKKCGLIPPALAE
ncbi:hypothetical protein FACS1894139_09010 [Planctomycetales bacterium]|nr:hypothetical protein FACS1894107_11940 [Planctomycetales bacterium]GHS98137.1 hypothetical protein FACS1894108_05740 [Planctomycetales bacterium]GHT05350.1 hypothetical protein FACS1894139_09010 [Planctomycetales bacterium]